MDFLASLVRDIEAPIDNDLHLVVGILVNKRCAYSKQGTETRQYEVVADANSRPSKNLPNLMLLEEIYVI
jgi:hypothetical protein